VSFTKGCYTGQELVARIDSRGGNVPQRLVLLTIEDGVPPIGASLVDADKTVGSVTSVVGTSAATYALAYLARGVETPADVSVQTDGESWTAAASALAAT